jgi:hypothetical protein
MPLAACAKVIKYAPSTCAVVAGGVAQIAIFDATLFDFTQAAPSAGVIQPYTAIADLGTSTKMYPIKFTRMQAEYTYDQKNTDGVVASYNHKLSFPVPDISMLTAQWSTLVDSQGYCCGVGIVIFLNSGRILIMGEGSVNAASLTVPFYTYQDGSKATSGKKMDDQNQNTVTLVGQYNRPLIEYTGAASTITALFA